MFSCKIDFDFCCYIYILCLCFVGNLLNQASVLSFGLKIKLCFILFFGPGEVGVGGVSFILALIGCCENVGKCYGLVFVNVVVGTI